MSYLFRKVIPKGFVNFQQHLKSFSISARPRNFQILRNCRNSQQSYSKILHNLTIRRSKSDHDAENNVPDEKVKNDQEMKDFLKEIRKDFGVKEPPQEASEKNDNIEQPEKLQHSFKQSFTEFQDNSQIILDFSEEQQLEEEMVEDEIFRPKKRKDDFEGISLQRGKNGVFDIGELVEILHAERAQEITVIKCPEHLNYADYLVIVTAFSSKHCQQLAEFIRKLHKRKKHEFDHYVRIEGEDSRDWKVLDFENIVLHIFLSEARETYDIETLWTCGPEYDDEMHKPVDPYVTLLDKHLKELESYHPDVEQVTIYKEK